MRWCNEWYRGFRRTGSAVLKLQIEALEKEGLGKTISNPKLFTLDNQIALLHKVFKYL